MTRTALISKFSLVGLYAIIAVAIFVTAMFVVQEKDDDVTKVFLGGEEIMVTIADTPELMSKGLSGRENLKPNEGMLFVFPEPGFYGFWMKDMKISIDIIWLDEKRQIVDVWEDADRDSYPKVYKPRSEAQYVLEVRAGFYRDHNLKSGDVLELK